MGCTPRTAFIWRVVYACSGIVIGLSVCAVFGGVFNNYAASILGLVSALLSVVCLLEFIFLYKVSMGAVQECSCSTHMTILTTFGVVGVAGIGLGIGCFIAFLGLGIIDALNHDHVDLPRSYFLGCVWAFVTFKWGLTAFLYTLKTFRRIYHYRISGHLQEEDSGRLIDPQPPSLSPKSDLEEA